MSLQFDKGYLGFSDKATQCCDIAAMSQHFANRTGTSCDKDLLNNE